MMKFTITHLNELENVAEQIAAKLEHPIVLFKAEMGAGKTTLIKQLVKAMGGKDEVSSPTFSLVNEYATSMGKVYHFDLYRIKTLEEALDFGVEEYLESGDFCFIEWPDLITDLLPEQYHTIKITMDEQVRRIGFG